LQCGDVPGLQRQAAPEYSGGVTTAPPTLDPPRSLPTWWLWAGLTVGVLAVSTSSILIRVADAPALSLAFWRCGLGAAAMAPFAARSRRGQGLFDGSQRRQLVAAGLFLAGHFAAFISSLSFTTVASAAVLVTMAPLFVGMGAAVFLREPPTRTTWIGIAIAIAGALGIAVADLEGLAGGDALLGDALAFGGAALVAGYLIIGRRLRQSVAVSRYAATVYGVAAAALLPACLLTGAALWGYDRGTWLAIAGLVLGPQLLGHTVFNSLLSAVTPTVIAVVVLAEPVGSTILALLLLDEAPSPGFWLAAPLIAAGVWISIQGTRAAAQPDVASREPAGE
jgi:drug/metabolite transporter (DMT)-like permease